MSNRLQKISSLKRAKSPKGKKRWLLVTYNKKKQHIRVIGDVAVMPKTEAKAIVSDATRRHL